MTARVLAADRVLTGPAGEAITGGAVLFDEETVRDVGDRAAVLGRAPAGTAVIDLPGATLLPGLIDTHVHLALDASEDPVGPLTAGDPELLLAMAGRAQRLLESGVTTVRDLGDRGNLAVRLRDAVAAGSLPGPRIVAAGAPITITGGHCWFMGGEADSPEELRRAVRRTVRDGADLVKIMVTGGHLTAGGPPVGRLQFSAEEIAIVVEEARRFGRPVAAHVHGAEGVAAALAAGVDTMEHCALPPDGDGVSHDELLRGIAERGIFVCPTLSGALDRTAELVGMDHIRPWLAGILHKREMGVRLVAGTDAGIPNARFEDYAAGLRWFARAGLPNDVVLEMATSTAGEAVGLGGRTGRLAPGYAADILAVTGDPRQDLAALEKVEIVVARGRAHVPAARALEHARPRPDTRTPAADARGADA